MFLLNDREIAKVTLFSYRTYADLFVIHKIWMLFKGQLFWEGHKNLCNLPHGFDVC